MTPKYFVPALLAVVSLFEPTILQGQRSFQLSTKSIDYTRYSSPWECLEAANRVRDSLVFHSPVWIDTLPPDPDGALPPLPEPIVQLAQRCGPQSLAEPVKLANDWIKLFLLRGDTVAAGELARSSILQGKYNVPLDLQDAIAEMLQVYNDVPERPHISPEILHDIFTKMKVAPEIQITTWSLYIKGAKLRRNQDQVEMAGTYITELVKNLKGGELDGSQLREGIITGTLARYERALMDTLRKSGTVAYQAFREKIFTEAREAGWLRGLGGAGIRGTAKAPPVEAVIWYPNAPSKAIPSRGQVSLLVFTDTRAHTSIAGHESESFERYAVLRRLKQKFPDLEITIVLRTLGWFWHGNPLSVREQGEVFQHWLIDTRKLPARIAVDSTPWYNLPEPDSRRVNQRSENDVHYGLGRAGAKTGDRLTGGREYAVLVSKDGLIMKSGHLLTRQSERDLIEWIGILSGLPAGGE